QGAEWSAERGLDWWVLGDEHHAGTQQLVKDLNRAYRENPALWALDYSPDGFGWIDANDAGGNVIALLRFAGDAPPPVPGAAEREGAGAALGGAGAAEPGRAGAAAPRTGPGVLACIVNFT